MLSLVGCASRATPSAQPSSAGASAAPAQRSPFKPFDEVVRDAVRRDGFFETYEKGDQLFLVVPKERLGEKFLMGYQIAEGIGAAGLFGGTMLDIFEGSIVALERHGERVFLVRHPSRFTAEAGTPLEQAVDVAFGTSVLESAKIESIRPDSALVINVYDWVVSDLSGIGERVKRAAATRPETPGTATFDKARSHLVSVNGYPENLSIRAKLTFRPGQPAGYPSLADGRYVPVTVAYTMATLPAEPMEPRLADDRVGYFMTVRKDFSSDSDGFFERYVNRWRLEPSGEVVDGLMVPAAPIVYHIDPSVPEEFRPYLIAGVEAWNEAFEAAGWNDAIRAEMLPEGAAPEDLRYPTLRWSTSDQPGYGAIGPSIVDPRTGEILDADILFEANMVRGFQRDWRTIVSPGEAVQEMFTLADPGAERAALSAEISAHGALLRALLAAGGEIDPTAPVPRSYVGEALKWVTMHEVGHTLGLRHNFRSSVDTPLERLHDREWARERGVFSSAMEYPTVNVAPAGMEQGFYYNPGVGSYDRWAISFGYTADASAARDIARQAAMAGHSYGTDEDARGPGALDPTINVYDLGADPLAWGRQRAELIAGLWPRLPEAVLTDNSRYSDLTDAFGTLMGQYARALATGVKYIGGQYQYRDRFGDPDGRAPFVAVPRQRQREALRFLTEFGFGAAAFDVPPEVVRQFGADRWSHWGNGNSFGGRIDYPLHEQVLGVQTALLRQITDPLVFARIRDAEMKFGSDAVLPIPELVEELTGAIWSEVIRSDRAVVIPANRRDLQRAYLDRMEELVVSPAPRTPADARSIARMQLQDLARRIDRIVLRGGGDAYTRAHLAEARARIGKILDAGLEAEG